MLKMLNRFKLLLITSLIWLTIFSLIYKINNQNNDDNNSNEKRHLSSSSSSQLLLRSKFFPANDFSGSWNTIHEQHQQNVLKVGDGFQFSSFFSFIFLTIMMIIIILY